MLFEEGFFQNYSEINSLKKEIESLNDKLENSNIIVKELTSEILSLKEQVKSQNVKIESITKDVGELQKATKTSMRY